MRVRVFEAGGYLIMGVVNSYLPHIIMRCCWFNVHDTHHNCLL
jgi:hypothetical protein